MFRTFCQFYNFYNNNDNNFSYIQYKYPDICQKKIRQWPVNWKEQEHGLKQFKIMAAPPKKCNGEGEGGIDIKFWGIRGVTSLFNFRGLSKIMGEG